MIVVLFASSVFAQRTVNTGKEVPAAKPEKIIFAVINDGTSLEPIAFVESGRLVNTVDGGDDEQQLKVFSELYYKPKATYDLIFGGISDGKVEVKSSNPASDCGKNIAEISATAAKAKLKGFVMALATNISLKGNAAGLRRPPTAAEKTEIEALVRAALTKQKISAAAQKNLRFHNLTAVDVNNDGKAEIVGSYYVSPTATERALLFFIADKNAQGKYVLSHSNYERTAQKDVMSKDIKDLDTGVTHELFIDMLDYDGDGQSEIFTSKQGFEGTSFYVYHRSNAGKWAKVFETGNYHCAY